MQLTRDAARRVCASFAPAHRILIPLRPFGRPQSVSQSLSSVSRAHLRLSRVLSRPCSRSRTLATLSLQPLVLSCPWLSSSFSFGDINPAAPLASPLSRTLLFPPPRSHGNFFLFYAALYRCSCLLTHSPLQFFHRSLVRSLLPVSPSLSSLRPFARSHDRAPIHPTDFSLSFLSLSLSLRLPRALVYPSSNPHRARSHPPSPPHI